MSISVAWLRSIEYHKIELESFQGYVVADWGGWIPGARSKTHLGAYVAAIRARLDGRI
ncbi:hypothetical protein ACIOTN_17175 [Glutamicibacter sp. NPDC087661]|uniref:hypothetical protein n=1 Tax=Glutamicibacter sp. NPDC087661 TaxID=3363996 RepID=UPI00382D3DA2